MGEHDIDPAEVDSISAFGAVLTRLKERSGRSLSQLASATAGLDVHGAHGLRRSTLNGYFKGRHLPQQGVGREFRLLLRELGVRGDAQLEAWWATVERLRRRARNGGQGVGNPYPGLRSFDIADAAHFFGRSALTERLVDEVAAHVGEPVVVVGPSGAGKSSLLRAGLLPRLVDAGRPPVVVTPGKSPLEELARAEPGQRCPLVVDQLEEIFAADVDDAERRAFLAAVWSAARAEAVVLGLRADFYGHALRYPELAAALQNAQVVVGPMTEPELRAAVTEPARTVGMDVDDGLVELLVREVSPSAPQEPDAAHEPGVLPLLSHTLQATFDAALARDERVLGIQDYRSIGGIRHAIAETADAAYGGLGRHAQQVTRQVFLRLVQVGETTADTRRRVDRDELVGERPDAEAEEIDDILDTFIAHRLLTAGDTTVQISHEALLQAWPRLRGWLDDDRAGRQVHRRLTLAARTWRDNGRSDDDLYHGGTLAAALSWAGGHREELNPLEREFLDAGVGERDVAQAVARRRVRRRYQLTSAAVVMIVLAATAMWYAQRTRDAAERDGRLALSRDIAVKAERLRDSDPALAAQLAAVGYRSAPTAEARSALLDSSAHPIAARHYGQGGSTNVVAATTGVLATGAKNGTISLSRAGEDTAAGPALNLGSRAVAITISRDDTRLAVVGESGTVRLWNIADLAAPVELANLTGPSGVVASVAISPDGRTVAVGGADAKIHLWDLADPAGKKLLSGPRDAITSVAFAPDGKTLAAGSRDRMVHRFTLADPARPQPLPSLAGPGGQVFSVAISPDSRVLAAGTSADRAVYLWDVADPASPKPLGQLTGPASWVTFIDFSPDGDRIIAGSSDRKLWEWDLATRDVRRTLPHPGVITTATYVDEHTVVTLTEDGATRTWTVPGPVIDDFGDTVYSVAFAGARQTLAVGPGSQDNGIHLIDASASGKPARIGAALAPTGSQGKLSGPIAVSSDDRLLAAGTGNGGIHLWDIGDPAQPRQLADTGVVTGSTVAWVEFQPNGTVLAVATKDGSVTLLDLADPGHPKRLASMTETGRALNDVRFSPDGKLIVTGSDDGNAYLYDVGDPGRPRLLTRLQVGDAATSAAFSPDGAVLAVGAAADDNVYLWDLTDPGKPMAIGASLDGPVADLYQLTFHPERNELAAASVDGTIWLWDLTDPREPERTATVTASTDAAMSLAYSHDGAFLAGGSRDGSVRLWRTDPEATIRWLCTASGAGITTAEWEQFLPGTAYHPPCA
ncbi:WD40 repeat domain-containing protein [Amycolatopsis nigrescens]|uniref:WD40 repeat domain-containing protein n=1 Tax=Amycolatopsis nigrescens TaxID=381445 RepID=UPI000375D4B2|nr:WD40 repeat domain-containing protein [Amycolatopsis nigrescens]